MQLSTMQSQVAYWALQMTMVVTTTTVITTPTEISAWRTICCGEEVVVVDRCCIGSGNCKQSWMHICNSKIVHLMCRCVCNLMFSSEHQLHLTTPSEMWNTVAVNNSNTLWKALLPLTSGAYTCIRYCMKFTDVTHSTLPQSWQHWCSGHPLFAATS